MQYLSRLSIKSRLIFMLLAVSLSSILLIGVLAWRDAMNALNEMIPNQLTSIRTSKTYQIETYFEYIYSQTRTLAEDQMVVNAMKNFTVGYQEALDHSLTPEQLQELTDYYSLSFLPRLAKNSDDPPLSVMYRPQRLIANYFQYHYIVNNSFPMRLKSEMNSAPEDVTIYKEFHTVYQPLFNNLRREFGFYDIFLIELETGNIVYSVAKEVDFATSLSEGPYRESGLGMLVAQVREKPERDRVTIVDYRLYEPSYNLPTAFVGAPIFDRNQVIGVLALQLPIDQINKIMTSNGNWEGDGLGKSGHTYLVGSDHLMRSTVRFYHSDAEAYLGQLLDVGFSAYTIDRIRNQGTTISLQPVYTDAVDQALSGNSTTRIIQDYRGIPVLSSYAPVQISGLNWVILSEIEVSEAFAPAYKLQRTMLIWGIGLILAVAFLAIILSNYFVYPIEILSMGVNRIASGEENVHIDIHTRDEFDTLAQNINMMVDRIETQKEIIGQKDSENEKLLLNILPATFLRRMNHGEQVVDQLQQVSVIFVHLLGFIELSTYQTALESANLLERLTIKLDQDVNRHGLQRVKTVGQTYIAASGLTEVQLDYTSRSINFAIDVLRTIQQISSEYDNKLAVQIGIHAGPVISGVIHSERLDFELWGETVDIANHLYTMAEPNSILITDIVQQHAEEFTLQALDPIVYANHDIPIYQVIIGQKAEMEES